MSDATAGRRGARGLEGTAARALPLVQADARVEGCDRRRVSDDARGVSVAGRGSLGSDARDVTLLRTDGPHRLRARRKARGVGGRLACGGPAVPTAAEGGRRVARGARRARPHQRRAAAGLRLWPARRRGAARALRPGREDVPIPASRYYLRPRGFSRTPRASAFFVGTYPAVRRRRSRPWAR